MTKHGRHYCEAFRLAQHSSKHPNRSLIPSLSSRFKAARGLERRGSYVWLSPLHLTGAHTDFCPAKTNGDSLNPRSLRPEGAINNTGPLQVTEP